MCACYLALHSTATMIDGNYICLLSGGGRGRLMYLKNNKPTVDLHATNNNTKAKASLSEVVPSIGHDHDRCICTIKLHNHHPYSYTPLNTGFQTKECDLFATLERERQQFTLRLPGRSSRKYEYQQHQPPCAVNGKHLLFLDAASSRNCRHSR